MHHSILVFLFFFAADYSCGCTFSIELASEMSTAGITARSTVREIIVTPHHNDATPLHHNHVPPFTTDVFHPYAAMMQPLYALCHKKKILKVPHQYIEEMGVYLSEKLRRRRMKTIDKALRSWSDVS